ncbi:hypothetical protein [Undibacterium pigrum]|uniref:Uncharacterized protein n=1 Tax=Undibacterium pigrum TaxID=401470 RepID=A0A318JCY6_9BURK|nr:hypothetical protein [Undibacterium pigrum]PXX41668.1 hypothetical protein DFR42_107320 [Undibacterium pigrum]
MTNFQRIFGDDGLPYLIDTSSKGENKSYFPWNSGNDDLELRSEPPPFSRGMGMEFGYGQDMARFRDFEPSAPDSIDAILDSRELATSDFLRAEKAGYHEGDFDLYDFAAPDNRFGRAALQERKKSTPMKKVMQQRKEESARDRQLLPVNTTADMSLYSMPSSGNGIAGIDKGASNRGLLNQEDMRMMPRYYTAFPSQKPGHVYSPHLNRQDIVNFYSGKWDGLKSGAQDLIDGIPKIPSALGAMVNDFPTVSIEGGKRMQDEQRRAFLDARSGDFRTAGIEEGRVQGSSLAGTALGFGVGKTLSLGAQSVNAIRRANIIAAQEKKLINAERIANNFGADSGYEPYVYSLLATPGTKDLMANISNPLLLYGHVGYSFDRGNTIYGHGPKIVSDIENAGARLRKGEVVPGIINKDKEFFESALESKLQARGGLGKQTVYKLDLPVTRPQFEFAQQLHNSRGVGVTLPEFPYSFKPGGGRQGPYNCATYPASLGLPIPENSGTLLKYIPKMIDAGAVPWK